MVTNLGILNAFLIDEVTQENYFSKLLDLFTHGLLQNETNCLERKVLHPNRRVFNRPNP